MSIPAALVRDEAQGPFAREGGAFTLRVAGRALESLDVHDGDRVVLVRDRVPEFGDLAALRVAGDARTLWKVYPEGERLHLSNGRGRRTVPTSAVEVVGVVVAVQRRFT